MGSNPGKRMVAIRDKVLVRIVEPDEFLVKVKKSPRNQNMFDAEVLAAGPETSFVEPGDRVKIDTVYMNGEELLSGAVKELCVQESEIACVIEQ